jgi:hypothetical protein
MSQPIFVGDRVIYNGMAHATVVLVDGNTYHLLRDDGIDGGGIRITNRNAWLCYRDSITRVYKPGEIVRYGPYIPIAKRLPA